MLLLLPFRTSKLVAQQRPPVQGRDIHAVIETPRPAYHVGDTIRVRISLTNVSNDTIGFYPAPPWAQVLLVLKRNGEVVQATTRPWGIAGSSLSARLSPHETVVWGWDQKFEWNPLAAWGYHLREPGTYTIVGIPQVSAARGVVEDLTTVRSNVVTITVTP
jgi:hypothetical protein